MSTDHESIKWCFELVDALASGMLDLAAIARRGTAKYL